MVLLPKKLLKEPLQRAITKIKTFTRAANNENNRGHYYVLVFCKTCLNNNGTCLELRFDSAVVRINWHVPFVSFKSKSELLFYTAP